MSHSPCCSAFLRLCYVERYTQVVQPTSICLGPRFVCISGIRLYLPGHTDPLALFLLAAFVPFWFALHGAPQPRRFRYQHISSADSSPTKSTTALAWRSPKSWKPTWSLVIVAFSRLLFSRAEARRPNAVVVALGALPIELLSHVTE